MIRDLQQLDLFDHDMSMKTCSPRKHIDSPPPCVVLLMNDGRVVANNNSWVDFANQYGDPLPQDPVTRTSDFEIANLDTRMDLASQFAINQGIKDVLNGLRSHYTLEYACRTTTQTQWYEVHITHAAEMTQRIAILVVHDISGKKEAEIRAQEAAERFGLLLDGVKNYDVVLLDCDGIVTSWQTSADRFANVNVNDFIGHPISHIYPEKDVAAGKPDRELKETALKGRMEYEGWRLKSDGTWYWARLVSVALRDDVGRPRGYAIVMSDTTAQKQTETALRSVVDHSIDAIITVDHRGIIQSFAGAAGKIFGYTASEVVGTNVNRLMPAPWRGEHDRYMTEYMESGRAKVIGIGREVTGQRKDGSKVPLDLTVTEFVLDGARFFTGILRDITERKAVQQQLQMQATRDLLTGVWNRTAVLNLLENELCQAKREVKPLGLLFVDVDHFKSINDTYGHQAGDAVLRTACERMQAITRPYDLIGRYGGEEFLVIVPGCDDASIRAVAERLRTHLADSTTVYADTEVKFTVSIGAAFANQTQDVGIETLIRSADLALYRAKSGGRNRVEMASM